jgi:hypothetical protein
MHGRCLKNGGKSAVFGPISAGDNRLDTFQQRS